MKKTININLAGLAFQIDDDAYTLLENYLNKVKATFNNSEEQGEIINDIENRFAELFTEKLGKFTQVVNINMVKESIATLGDVEVIDEETNGSNENQNSYKQNSGTTRKLFRNPDDKIIAGVLGGLGAYLGIDAIWLRLIFVILGIASVGVPVGGIYIILWIIMPKAETNIQKMQMKGEPINLSNISESVKKNFSKENLAELGKTGGRNAEEILKLLFKAALLIVGLILFFKFFVFSIAWSGGTFFINFFGEEYLNLVFSSNFFFLLFAFSIFALVAIPSIFLLYLIAKAYKKSKVSWAKTLIISGVLMLVALLAFVVATVDVAKNFSKEEIAFNYIDVPFADSLKTVTINFKQSELDEEGGFQFNINEDGFNAKNILYRPEINTLFLNSAILQVKPAKEFKLEAAVSSRGRTVEECKQHIDKISYQLEFKDSSELVLPTTLEIKDEGQFRFQKVKYTLEVPVGTEINFGKYTSKYIKDPVLQATKKSKDLDNNTWLMTENGLACLTCEVD
ncbi:MAG: PspC domain-containing protein [Chitinophagales bacterium]|nr:PspC domain-containing protein [Chitinophagales bacterium]